MPFGIIRLISILISVFILFFGVIAQINTLSVLNQESRILARDNSKFDTQKEILLQENMQTLRKEIDIQIAKGQIQPITISEKIKPEELQKQIEAQQKQQQAPAQNNPAIVTR